MGGHALKKVRTRRLEAAEYERLKAHVLVLLQASPLVQACEAVRELPGKTSFGDLDILVLPAAGVGVPDIGREVFQPRELVRNGEVTSLDVDDFQVDLIAVASAERLRMAAFYFAYSDVGNLLGRICKAHGLKLGHQGLQAELLPAVAAGLCSAAELAEDPDLAEAAAQDTRLDLGTVLLSADPQAICAFLGLDAAAHAAGLASSEAVMDFVLGCRLFRPELFAGRAGNAGDRRRERIRPFHKAFVERAQVMLDTAEATEPAEDAAARRHCERVFTQRHALDFFAAGEAARAVLAARRRRRAVRRAFNAGVFVARGLAGPDLGRAMAAFPKFALAQPEAEDVAAADEGVLRERFDTLVLALGAGGMEVLASRFLAEAADPEVTGR